MTAAASRTAGNRPILPGERSGVLHPGNLARYDAHWIAPDPAVSAAVDQYWHVSWALRDGERLDQRIIDLPAITVTIEEGDVPAPLVTGVQARAWRRTVHGRGGVFAIRLRPAGLAALSDLAPEQLANATVPLTETLDAGLHELVRHIAAQPTPAARIHSGTSVPLSRRFHVHERTIQRALKVTLGHGPKWISRRVRLQEVALALAARLNDDLASIAADLGYTDQSHLASDFRAVAGVTPSTYRRDLARLHLG